VVKCGTGRKYFTGSACITKGRQKLVLLWSITWRCQDNIEFFTTVWVSHIRREVNGATHMLANDALSLSNEV
jgi:hypothetical protein